MSKSQISPEIAMLNNNLMAAIRATNDNIGFLTLMVDSLIESLGEDKVEFINRSINKKVYINLLESKKFNDNRELQPDEPLDAKLVQGAKIQEQIDLLRNDLIDRFGIGLVKEVESMEDKPAWVKGKLLKI